MFASSRCRMPPRITTESPARPFAEGEGRACELSRRATQALLWPRGRPGGWLLVLAAACALVLVLAVRLHAA